MARWYLVLVAACALYVTGAQEYDPEDENLTAPQLIVKYNYPVEVRHVTTSDGYILEMHRIPNTGSKLAPVLLIHGIFSSSVDWIITGREWGLGYILADAGYDVWLGNCRGNYYSRNHTTRNPNSSKFWDFSWQEIGLKDIPAMIDYILDTTGKTKMHYVGHSQGTTVFFVMNSRLPKYNDRFISAHLIAPITVLNNIGTFLTKALASVSNILGTVITILGKEEVFPLGADFQVVNGELSCKLGSILCPPLLSFLKDQVGDNPFLIKMLRNLFEHFPAGASVNQLVHYGQVIKSKVFRSYDRLTILGNLKEYLTPKPPVFNLSTITGNISLYFSNADNLAVKEDVLTTAAELKSASLKLFETVNLTHFQLIWSPEAKEPIFMRILESMSNY